MGSSIRNIMRIRISFQLFIFHFEYFPKVDAILPNKSMMSFDHSPFLRSFSIDRSWMLASKFIGGEISSFCLYFRRLVLFANRVSKREFNLCLFFHMYELVVVCSFIGSHMHKVSGLCGCYSVRSFARTFVCMLVFHVVVCISVCHKGCETLRACRSREIFKVILLFPR